MKNAFEYWNCIKLISNLVRKKKERKKSENSSLPPLAKLELSLPALFLLPREEGSLSEGTESRWAGRSSPGASLRGESPPTPGPGTPPATHRAHSDGVLLARDALGAALVPGLRVLPGPGVASGHQALLAEAAAAARPVPFPRAPHPLVLRAPEVTSGG